MNQLYPALYFFYHYLLSLKIVQIEEDFYHDLQPMSKIHFTKEVTWEVSCFCQRTNFFAIIDYYGRVQMKTLPFKSDF